MLINASGCLRLFVDGRDVGTIAKNVPKSCYAMFDLFGRNKKVCSLFDKYNLICKTVISSYD